MKTRERSRRGKRLGNFLASVLVLGFGCGVMAGESAAQREKPSVRVTDEPLGRESRVTSFAPVVRRVAPGVVNIYSTKTVRERRIPFPLFDDPIFRRFFGENELGGETRPRREQGLGSGVIVSEEGYIMTNNHVVEGADEIRVVLASGAEFKAKVVGTDPPTDLAVVKVEGEKLPAVTMADSSKLAVGDVVLAIGNPFGVGQTVTMGIVSATERSGFGIVDYEDFIQTDASINPGNSGGALADGDGRLVGINTAILSRTGGNQGIGFAVPVNLARFIMDRIIKDGRVVRGYLGVYVQRLTPELVTAFGLADKKGALVGGLATNSPAAKAGLKEGDVIIEFNGKKISDSRELRMLAAQTPPNTKVTLKFMRERKEQTATVTLGELPTEEFASRREESEGDEGVGSFLEGTRLADLDARVRQQLDVPAELAGVLVVDVDPGSGAAQEGLRPGDIILEINRQPVKSVREAITLARRAKKGSVLLRVWTRGATHYLVVPNPGPRR